ncbi:hypothetical protein SMICM17S_05178 [Streptomyces microflavus]
MPLYEAVYERLDVGGGTRMLGLGCGSGLALLMAASRGAAVTGVDSRSPELLALARRRLLGATPGEPGTGDAESTRARADAPRFVEGSPGDAADPTVPAFTPGDRLRTHRMPRGRLRGARRAARPGDAARRTTCPLVVGDVPQRVEDHQADRPGQVERARGGLQASGSYRSASR